MSQLQKYYCFRFWEFGSYGVWEIKNTPKPPISKSPSGESNCNEYNFKI